ncbi:MAG: bifunctional ornithine acetyltransferase/N-acetylglutamate synthase [Planctomycetota bacterium]|nr:MAG: bifunctional ornithine acetyltransferase/N-acetylglutamate synthase [Planctomycetota bacterium]
MASHDPLFSSADDHLRWLTQQASLPQGWRVATGSCPFTPPESGNAAQVTLSLLVPDRPTPAFAGVFTRNAFPGAPIIVGRKRLLESHCGGVVINNKISNVCAPEGISRAEEVCAAVGTALGLPGQQIIPSSTGVIGWRLPAEELSAIAPSVVADLQSHSILPAAQGIMTTDCFPKVRRVRLPGGACIVGIAKGAGMVEPNMATMLVYLLTDAVVEREQLRAALPAAVAPSFNAISIDSDQSTSDTVLALSSQVIPGVSDDSLRQGLRQLCMELAEDVVRNGEGVRHVQRVTVRGTKDDAMAKTIGKAVINAPLWKTALAGNDPNVGRLLMAVGKALGNQYPDFCGDALRMSIADEEIFAQGCFQLNPEREQRLQAYFQHCELYPARPASDGITFTSPVRYPPHPRVVEISIDLGRGDGAFTVIGGDLTHEYITENADYRS